MAAPSREFFLLIALLPLLAASVAGMKDGFRIKVMYRCWQRVADVAIGSIVCNAVYPCIASRSGCPIRGGVKNTRDLRQFEFVFVIFLLYFAVEP